MAKKIESIGFGFIPKETEHHFYVYVPKSKTKEIEIYERFKWDYDSEIQTIRKDDILKVKLTSTKWDLIKGSLKEVFNNRLKSNNIKLSDWKEKTVVERLLGKELILLCWAIEDAELSQVEYAIKNWLGLSPEERWWLFTMTNAGTGRFDDRRGWRKAIRFALTENPIFDTNKNNVLFDDYFEHVVKK